MSNPNQILDEQLLSKLPEELRQEVKKRLIDVINYTPRIGVMGKSGAGKSSLINAIVGKQVCKTGGVGGCTRAFQEERSIIGNSTIIFMDLPGIAENQNRDLEYKKLYAEKVKGLDLILWVIKVDDRANQNDEEFYNWLIKYCHKERILFVLSQCDKAEPSRDWDYKTYQPSEAQLSIINQNKQRIVNDFKVSSDNVLPVACEYYNGKFDRWQIELLMTRVIQCIPPEASPIVYKHMDRQNRTPESDKKAKEDWGNILDKIIDFAIDNIPAPKIVKDTLKAGKEFIKDVGERVFNFFFG